MAWIEEVGRYLLAAILCGVIIWQLRTGKVLDEDWSTWGTREEKPLAYWGVIAFQCVLLLLVLFVI